MNFSIEKSIDVLQRTPDVLYTLLQNISIDWTAHNEGEETWSVYDVVGHLIHGENTDWVTKMEIILSNNEEKRFKPFDRFAQFNESKGKTLEDLLSEFKDLRLKNIELLQQKNITGSMLQLKGVHPVFGEVTLQQLLATWVVHDMNHIAQISRVMAKQYKEEVGPWVEYLSVLKS